MLWVCFVPLLLHATGHIPLKARPPAEAGPILPHSGFLSTPAPVSTQTGLEGLHQAPLITPCTCGICQPRPSAAQQALLLRESRNHCPPACPPEASLHAHAAPFGVLPRTSACTSRAHSIAASLGPPRLHPAPVSAKRCVFWEQTMWRSRLCHVAARVRAIGLPAVSV